MEYIYKKKEKNSQNPIRRRRNPNTQSQFTSSPIIPKTTPLPPAHRRHTAATTTTSKPIPQRRKTEAMASKYDLTPRIAPQLDRHLVFPLFEFLQERGLYPEEDILKAKIELLNNTNMVDYAMDIHKSLYRSDDVPQGIYV